MSPAKKKSTKVARKTAPKALAVSKKSVSKKSVTKKSVTKKSVTKKSGIKPAGNPQSRRAVSDATKRVLAHCEGMTPTLASKSLGVGVDDIANMRAGYQWLTVAVLLKMVRNGHFDPRSIVEGPKLRKLPAKRDTRGAQQRLVNARMNKLAWSRSGMEWARLTGLSMVGAYGLRYNKTANVKLGTILAFAAVGPSLEEIIFGD